MTSEIGVSDLSSVCGISFSPMCCGSKEEEDETPQTYHHLMKSCGAPEQIFAFKLLILIIWVISLTNVL